MNHFCKELYGSIKTNPLWYVVIRLSKNGEVALNCAGLISNWKNCSTARKLRADGRANEASTDPWTHAMEG
jgi:hypothetical protein